MLFFFSALIHGVYIFLNNYPCDRCVRCARCMATRTRPKLVLGEGAEAPAASARAPPADHRQAVLVGRNTAVA
jgi:hypothetical protein